MKLFNNVRYYIGENDFKLIIFGDKIDVINYDSIKEISNTKIVIFHNKEIIINGNNLKINKLLNNEVLIKGKITEIIFNE